MKILFKSIYLYFLGLRAEFYKHHFDAVMDRYVSHGKDISCRRLTDMSNKSYGLYKKFRECEKTLKYEISIKRT